MTPSLRHVGTAEGGSEPDPFEQLLDPAFVSNAVHQELSAEERQRVAERAARTADLQRRLAADEEERARQSVVDRESAKRSVRKERTRKYGALLLLVTVVGGIAVYMSRGDGSGLTTETARPSNFPPVDKSASAKPLGTPPPAPSPSGGFEFIRTQKVGKGPVAWDPCRPVRYVVNPVGAPAGGDLLIKEAVQRTAEPTGLTFVDEGTTDEVWAKDREPYQPDRYGKKWAPVLIAWTTEQAEAVVDGAVAGQGGPTSVRQSDGRKVNVSGAVVLDAADIGRVLTYPDGQAKARAIVQHELGHVVGLGHTNDRTQLMYSENTDEQTGDWGTGDLAGLRQLGLGDCMPDV